MSKSGGVEEVSQSTSTSTKRKKETEDSPLPHPDSEEFKKIVKDAFIAFDTTKSRSLSGNELQTVMKKMGHNLSDEEVELIIKEGDKSKTGELNFKEFLKLMKIFSTVKGNF